MDGIALLGEARAAGLTVDADDGRLRIRGPASAGDVARRLLDHKADVLRALDLPDADPEAPAPLDAAPVVTPDALPVGWPADVPRPDWWPELTAAAVKVLAARRVTCPGCGFGVAALWAGHEGARWSCPSCGLDSSTDDVPDWFTLDPPDGWRCPRCSGMLWWEDCGSLERPPARRCVACDGDALARCDAVAARAAKLRAEAETA